METSDFIISLDEVASAIYKCNASAAPGPDGIPISVFQGMGLTEVKLLTHMFQLWINYGQIPKRCKEAIQVALPKRSGGYRPITMINCVVRIFERIILERIAPILNQHIPDYQFGFRESLGAPDQLITFIEKLQRNKNSKRHAVILFTDIKKAYDRVCRKTLICKLNALGIQGTILKLIDNLIASYTCSVVLDGFVSRPYETVEGIPQGSILSPILWNVFFSDIPTNIGQGFLSAFADDLAGVAFDSDLGNAKRRLSIYYARLRKWAKMNRVEFSDSKVKVLVIKSRKRKRSKTSYLQWNKVFYIENGKRIEIEEVTHYRYLGAVIDGNLNFRTWTDEIVRNCKGRLAFISKLKNCLKLGRRTLEILYQGYVRGYLNYGIEILRGTSNFKKIEIADRNGIRRITGILKLTSNVLLDQESNIDNIEQVTTRKIFTRIRKICCVKPVYVYTYFLTTLELMNNSTRTRTVFQVMLQEWLDKNMPYNFWEFGDMEWNQSAEVTQKRKKHFWKYHPNIRKELFLTRLRVGILPTNVWKCRLGLSGYSKCRHCGQTDETLEHLLVNRCPELDYSWLSEYCFNGIDELINMLNNENFRGRPTLENSLFRFVSTNKCLE